MVKYEEVYLKAYQDSREARHSLTRYFRFYYTGRLISLWSEPLLNEC